MNRYFFICFLNFLLTSKSHAQNASDISQINSSEEIENDTIKRKKRVLDEIKVSSQYKKTVTAVRSSLKTIDNPQSLQVINNEIIQQQQTIRLSDVIKNANGVYVGSARGGAQESFWSRSYDMSANNMFKMVFATMVVLSQKFHLWKK